jgi:hypothetical protein
MRNKHIIAIMALTMMTLLSFGQQKRSIGLTGTFDAGQYGIQVPIFVTGKFSLAPVLEVKYAEKVSTDLGIGLEARKYFKVEKLSPYAGIKVGALFNFPSSKNEIDTENKTDILAGLAFGAEYFLDDNFSLGIEAQGNFTKSDVGSYRFGNPGRINFNTGTMLSATVYF